MRRHCFAAAVALTVAGAASTAAAQAPAPAAAQPTAPTSVAAPPAAVNTGIKPPAGYVIGVDDQFDVVYWQDKDMSASVVVRPDGNISLPLLNDIPAAGLTPEELRQAITKAATKFVEGPTVSVVIKQINSRKVFISGQIGKPGPYPLMDAMTVLQLIATAGGPTEYAKTEEITIIRTENGKQTARRFNYRDVAKGKNLAQNIELKPGDSIVIP